MICRGFLTPKKIKISETHTPELRGTYGSLGKSKKPLSPSREAGKESAVSGTSVPYEPGAHPIGAPIKTPNEGHTILSDDEIRRALTRIAFEILESNKGTDNLVLLGIRSRGYPLAQRLAQRIQTNDSNFDLKNGLGALDITSYRDDLTDEEYENRSAGDVLSSGRTVRAALDALNEYGRPALVRLAVLVDRGHRQLPIRADHVGKNLPTSALEKVRVVLEETDNATDRVDIIQLEGQLS